MRVFPCCRPRHPNRSSAVLRLAGAALAAALVAGAAVVPRPALAASSCLPAETPLVIDPSQSPPDTQPPSAPAIGAIEIRRGQQAGCAESAAMSCEAVGQVRMMITASDDRTPAAELGYRASVTRGTPPATFGPLGAAILAGADGNLVLSWTDGATAGQEPIDFDLQIETVDGAGNVSSGAATVTIQDPGSSGGCRIAPGRGGLVGARDLAADLVTVLALAGTSLGWRRRRRDHSLRASLARQSPPGSVRHLMAEFFAPGALAAVALMAFNDYVLKRWAPGALSGKLSDVAICFFLPLYLSALLGLVAPRRILLRLTAAAVVTAVLFASLKLSVAAASGFCHLNDAVAGTLGIARRCRLTRDPTDLAALIFVPLAWLYGRARLRGQPRRDRDISVGIEAPAGSGGA